MLNPTYKDHAWLDYLNLIANVKAISESAADYLLKEAIWLDSFNPTHDLDSAFVWAYSPQGDAYWSAIYEDLEYLKPEES
jgi:hypothetical protein